MPSVLTANLLGSGEVVYLSRDKGWVADLQEADVISDIKSAESKDREASALASVKRNEVTAVYVMEVRIVEDRTMPVSVRESIRAAHAPSI